MDDQGRHAARRSSVRHLVAHGNPASSFGRCPSNQCATADCLGVSRRRSYSGIRDRDGLAAIQLVCLHCPSRRCMGLCHSNLACFRSRLSTDAASSFAARLRRRRPAKRLGMARSLTAALECSSKQVGQEKVVQANSRVWHQTLLRRVSLDATAETSTSSRAQTRLARCTQKNWRSCCIVPRSRSGRRMKAELLWFGRFHTRPH
jgi:hypothetical protein